MQVVRVAEGERTEYGITEYLDERNATYAPTIPVLGFRNALIAEGELVNKVQHNAHVAERALEEDDVFAAKVWIPGWLFNDKEKLTDAHGTVHGSDTQTVTGLVEDYSEKAWRLITEETGANGDLVYQYRWAFLPKSQVSLMTVEGVNSGSDYDDLRETLHQYREENEETPEGGWRERLDAITDDEDDEDDGEPGWSADDFDTRFRVGDTVRNSGDGPDTATVFSVVMNPDDEDVDVMYCLRQGSERFRAPESDLSPAGDGEGGASA